MQPPRPFTLIAELTYRCPLHCPYCSNPVDIGASTYRGELGTDDWIRTFGQARGLGVLQLALTGGEPMLRRDLPELCAAARDAGLYSSLITAGTLFTPERAEALKAAGLDHVQISIAEPRPAGERPHRGQPVVQQEDRGAARAARELDFPLSINCVLHREEPRPDRGTARPDPRAWGTAARAREHPVLRVGGPQPGGAAAELGAASARRGSRTALPRTRRSQGRRPVGAPRLLRGSAQAVHGGLGPDRDRGGTERRRAALPGGVDDPRARVRQRLRAPARLDLERVRRVRPVPRYRLDAEAVPVVPARTPGGGLGRVPLPGPAAER